MTSGLLELHSTPWSSCQPLLPNKTRYKEFCSAVTSHSSSSFEIDLHTLLSQKYTGERCLQRQSIKNHSWMIYWLLCYLYPLGDVELKVHIVAFQFNSSPSQDAVLLMDGETPLERILDIVSGDITFTGCGLCCAELDTDENGIYRPCYPCLPHTGVRRYYRYCNTFQLIDVGFCLTIYAHIYLAVCLSGRLQLCANVASSFFFFFLFTYILFTYLPILFTYLYTIYLITYILYLLTVYTCIYKNISKYIFIYLYIYTFTHTVIHFQSSWVQSISRNSQHEDETSCVHTCIHT